MAPLRVPPNPFDRWARSESGLHLPSRLVPRAARRMHHIEKFGQAQCCCGGGTPPIKLCPYCNYDTSFLVVVPEKPGGLGESCFWPTPGSYLVGHDLGIDDLQDGTCWASYTTSNGVMIQVELVYQAGMGWPVGTLIVSFRSVIGSYVFFTQLSADGDYWDCAGLDEEQVPAASSWLQPFGCTEVPAYIIVSSVVEQS